MMGPSRWYLPRLTRAAQILVAQRAERFYAQGLTFEQAMDRATENLRYG